jgi:hypothetical protein
VKLTEYEPADALVTVIPELEVVIPHGVPEQIVPHAVV